MSIKGLNPYLMFNGNAARAIALYERALGAKADNVMRFGDVQGADTPKDQAERIMHAQLRIGDAVIMLSDGTPEDAPSQSNVHVALHFDDVADMTRRFDALAQGGEVTGPLQDTFWGARFGTLTDAFGIRWMFNCELHKKD